MAIRDINFINLIADLNKAGRSNKLEIGGILYRYDVPKIESLERRVLDYIFSVHEDELRFKLMNMIVEANNLPIIHECYYIIHSNLSKEEYITCQIRNLGKSRSSFNLKYELCLKIVSQSSLLQNAQDRISERKVHLTNVGGMKVISHKYRNRITKKF